MSSIQGSSPFEIASSRERFRIANRLSVTKIASQPISMLNDVIKAIPVAIAEKEFRIRGIDNGVSGGIMDGIPLFKGGEHCVDITYFSHGDHPAELIYNPKTKEWDSFPIPLS